MPIDASFHDFKIKRVSSTVIEFYIDGALVTTHTSPTHGMPQGALMPCAQSAGGNSTQGFLDVDHFTFTPV